MESTVFESNFLHTITVLSLNLNAVCRSRSETNSHDSWHTFVVLGTAIRFLFNNSAFFQKSMSLLLFISGHRDCCPWPSEETGCPPSWDRRGRLDRGRYLVITPLITTTVAVANVGVHRKRVFRDVRPDAKLFFFAFFFIWTIINRNNFCPRYHVKLFHFKMYSIFCLGKHATPTGRHVVVSLLPR